MWQSVKILNIFNTLNLKKFFWKTKSFLKKLEYSFLVETHHFYTKLPYQKSMLRQIEWWVQNRPITKNGVLPVTTFFWIFCFNLRTLYKELIWCTNDPNAHIRTFYRCSSFIWRCFFPVSILKRDICWDFILFVFLVEKSFFLLLLLL